MAKEIFNRQELKFIITRDTLQALQPVLERYMQFDKHNPDGKPYPLYNLYIDTADHQLIRRSLDKPVYKEKLRIRSYHPLDSDQPVFLELKKRYKKTTNKRRTEILYTDALQLVASGKVPQLQDYMNPQVVRELEATCSSQQYEPKVFISYERVAYIATGITEDLRITFDSQLTARRFKQAETVSLLPADKLIVEVKTMWGMPLWLTDLLREQGIQRQRFSKYGIEYHHYLQTNIRGVSHV